MPYIHDFSVLRTLEIATYIRIPDYRPTYSCMFTSLIESIRCLQAVTSAFYGEVMFSRQKRISLSEHYSLS